MNFDQRLSNLRHTLNENNLDGYAILSFEGSDQANLQYMTGFSGSFGIYFVTPDKATLYTDSRYLGRVKTEQPHLQVEQIKQWVAFSDILKNSGLKRVGVNAERLTVSQMQSLNEQLDGDLLHAGDDIVAELRQVKDDGEIDAIRKAQALTDKTFEFILGKLKPGISEREVAWEMEMYMRQNGAEGLAFPVMVGSGPNSALPHHDTGNRELQSGEYVLFDFGAKVGGYCSDMTRTVFLGSPTDKHREVYDTVLAAQQACLDYLKANLNGQDADKITRDVIVNAGYGENFGHGTGHGLGLEVHEGPGMGPLRESLLVEKAVVTVEPGIYIDGWGGVRIEDLVVLETDGITNLTSTPKDFVCL